MELSLPKLGGMCYRHKLTGLIYGPKARVSEGVGVGGRGEEEGEEEEEEEESPKELESEEEEIAIVAGGLGFLRYWLWEKEGVRCEEKPIRGEIK